MRKLFIVLAVLGLSVALAAPAFCEERKECGPGYGYGCGEGIGDMMGPGYGSGGHMMSPRHRACGMHGPGRDRHGRGWGWGPSARGWKSMKPEQRKKWEKMRSDYQQDTLELRKQLVTKQMELETLWAQPEVDSPRVDKLSKEVADLEAKLWKKRDEYLLQCRQNFGDQGWTCPGGRW
ncbi:MAG: periplasmic heavy metal sensor [Deltaproteobacteria bacterium]|nr:periplasmic heavy metal sensor [Deltaproteobacteria bacterium]